MCTFRSISVWYSGDLYDTLLLFVRCHAGYLDTCTGANLSTSDKSVCVMSVQIHMHQPSSRSFRILPDHHAMSWLVGATFKHQTQFPDMCAQQGYYFFGLPNNCQAAEVREQQPWFLRGALEARDFASFPAISGLSKRSCHT